MAAVADEGVAIARGIIESHGGHLWAESTQGQGSNFRFTLPLAGHDAPCSAGAPTPDGPSTRKREKAVL
jgi:hypothetical protein